LNNEVKLVEFGRYRLHSRPRTGLSWHVVYGFFSPFKRLTDVHETVPRRLLSTFFTLIFTNCPNIRHMLRLTDNVILLSDTNICMVTEIRKIADNICKISFLLPFLINVHTYTGLCRG
jgi:hypothetical protein